MNENAKLEKKMFTPNHVYQCLPKGPHVFIKCRVISVWHRTCLKFLYIAWLIVVGLRLYSSLKWTFLCHSFCSRWNIIFSFFLMNDSVLHIDPYLAFPFIHLFFLARLKYSNKKKPFSPILQIPGKWLSEFQSYVFPLFALSKLVEELSKHMP